MAELHPTAILRSDLLESKMRFLGDASECFEGNPSRLHEVVKTTAARALGPLGLSPDRRKPLNVFQLCRLTPS